MSVVSRLRDMGFTVRTRPEWGTRYESLYQERRLKKPFTLPAKYGFAHISVTHDDGPLTGDFDADMREVERIGYERFGSGFSYNWGVDPITGMIGEGQPLDAKGTHTVNDKGVAGFEYNLNLYGHAIAILGMPGVVASEKALRAYAAIMHAEQAEGAMVKGAPLYPHSKFAAKDCPTATIRDRIPEILKLVPTIAASTETYPVVNPPVNAAGKRVMHFGALRYAGEHRYVTNWYLAYVDQALSSLALLGIVPANHPRTEFPEAWQAFEREIGRSVVNSIPDEHSFTYFVQRCGYKPPDGSATCGGPTFINDWP